MDWRNYQFWRKSVRRVDEKETEFDLLVQRTKQRIVLSERIQESIRLFQGTSSSIEGTSKRKIIAGKLRDLQQNLPFFKKL